MSEWLKSLFRVRRHFPIEMGGMALIERLVVWNIYGELRRQIDWTRLAFGDLRIEGLVERTVTMRLPIILKPQTLGRLDEIKSVLADVLSAQRLHEVSLWQDADVIEVVPDVSLLTALGLYVRRSLLTIRRSPGQSSLSLEAYGAAGMNLAIAMVRAMGLEAGRIGSAPQEQPSLDGIVHYVLQYDDKATGLRFLEFRVVSCLVSTLDFPDDSRSMAADDSDDSFTTDYVVMMPFGSTQDVSINGLPLRKAVRLQKVTETMARHYLPFVE